MAKIALIKNGTVADVILADLSFAQTLPNIDYAADVTGMADVGIGWGYANGVFAAAPIPAAPVPSSVTMRQARLALSNAGLLDSVDAAINALPEPARTRAKIEWDYSNGLERGNAFVATLGVAMGLNDAAVDALFVEAATL